MDRKKSDIIIFSFFTIVAMLVLGFVVYFSNSQNIPIAHLTRDPLAVTDSPPYVGFLSNMGIIIWNITVGITLITSMVLFVKSDSRFRFFLYSCLFTFLLMVDDLFMLHESFYTRLYLPEKTLYGIYGLITMSFILKHIRILLKSYVPLFVMSIFFFFLSITFRYGNFSKLFLNLSSIPGARSRGRRNHHQTRTNLRGTNQNPKA